MVVRKYLLPLILSITFLITGILTLSDYGINWDAPLHMLRGQAYVDIFLNQKTPSTFKTPPNIFIPGTPISRYYFAAVETGDDSIENVTLPQRPLPQKEFKEAIKSQKDLSFYHHQIYSADDFKNKDSAGHLSFIATLSAFSNRLFFGKLGVLGDIESYQLIYVLISTSGVFVVSLFTFEITGSAFASIVAGLVIALYPLFFAESHFNMKDPEQAVFFAGSIWAFWHWVKSGKLGWFGVFGMFGGLALGVKWNIVFLPVILIPWLITIRKTTEFNVWFKLGRLGKLGGLGILGVIIFLIIIWPYAWSHPIQAFINTFNYYLDQGIGKALIQPSGFILAGGFNIYPLILLFTQTPEIILILGVVGVIRVVRERGGSLKIGYLILIWLLIPILRLSFPGARTYGGLRQIMEFLPALAVLAGVGAKYLLKRTKNNIAVITILIIITVILLPPLIRLHPNQNTYFNILAGGLKGAKEKNLIDWTLTYGNIYKQGVKWLNQHAEKDADLAHLAGSDFAISPLWLRGDISISPYHFSGFDQKGEYIMALYNPLDPPVFAKRYPEKFLNPVHTIDIDGVPLLFIYKNEPKYLKNGFIKEDTLKAVKMLPQSTKEADFWKIDLGGKYRVTRIVVNGVKSECIEGVEQNEAIAFIPISQTYQAIDLTKTYVLNEIRDLGVGRVEYSFAAEPARFIYIYPQNNHSCFAKQKILSVSYLSN